MSIHDITDTRQKAAAILSGRKLQMLEEAGLVVAERKELDLLRDVAVAAKAIRDGYSDIRWEEFCEALDALKEMEKDGPTRSDR